MAQASVVDARSGDALVTGATGFFGAAVVAACLDTGADVWCLVRTCDDEAATARARESLAALTSIDGAAAERVRGVAGDLTQQRFGLDEGAWSRLAARVSCVFHCGAAVNAALAYESIASANVTGTATTIAFAGAASARLVHISTTATTATCTGDVVTEHDRLGPADGLAGGYARSKWEAESLVEEATTTGLDGLVCRVGALAGHTVTGVSNQRDYRWLLLAASVRAGVAPLLRGTFTWLPVDLAAAAAVSLGLSPDPALPRAHLLSAPIRWLDAFSWARRRGFLMDVADLDHWRVCIEARAEFDDDARAIAMVAPEDDERPTDPVVDSSLTDAALAARGIALGGADEELVARYLKAAGMRVPATASAP